MQQLAEDEQLLESGRGTLGIPVLAEERASGYLSLGDPAKHRRPSWKNFAVLIALCTIWFP